MLTHWNTSTWITWLARHLQVRIIDVAWIKQFLGYGTGNSERQGIVRLDWLLYNCLSDKKYIHNFLLTHSTNSYDKGKSCSLFTDTGQAQCMLNVYLYNREYIHNIINYILLFVRVIALPYATKAACKRIRCSCCKWQSNECHSSVLRLDNANISQILT